MKRYSKKAVKIQKKGCKDTKRRLKRNRKKVEKIQKED